LTLIGLHGVISQKKIHFILENGHFLDRKGDGRMILRCILGRWDVRIDEWTGSVSCSIGALVLAVLNLRVLLPKFVTTEILESLGSFGETALFKHQMTVSDVFTWGIYLSYNDFDRLCGLVVRVSGYRFRGPGFGSLRFQIF
jgi:hypothetical protein